MEGGRERWEEMVGEKEKERGEAMERGQGKKREIESVRGKERRERERGCRETQRFRDGEKKAVRDGKGC